ncbi:hypothetical protein [Photobacterium alginatilyticum]|uniref:Uncharacterized protein n=1 Tax=Photobacterium alginatilyticum TaxID=1775171 RepID=A0ABW9YHC1_9GAMM|nr:hypothetical protein [Photobacterium alginatilyticum]NBI52534.1 hypothetical protein [Photobacterium alginatilyticum]
MKFPGMDVGTFSSTHPFEKQYMSFCEPTPARFFFCFSVAPVARCRLFVNPPANSQISLLNTFLKSAYCDVIIVQSPVEKHDEVQGSTY